LGRNTSTSNYERLAK